MKKTIIILMSLMGLLLSGCDSYLDRQPDEVLTEKDIFKKQATTFQYLVRVYSFVPYDSDPAGLNEGHQWTAAADESAVSYTWRNFTLLARDVWTPGDNVGFDYTYRDIWKGIREASYFMQHVYECPETELPLSEATNYYYEAKFLRAYFYWRLMMVYGPVFILGDAPADFIDATLSKRERNTWSECVKYVCDELDACAAHLPDSWSDVYFGRATKGAAMAVKARLLLYSASPLFNGNPLYASIVGHDGRNLFPTEYDAQKWKLAADAAQDIIDLNMYELLGENDGTPYKSLKNIFITRCHKELIFSRESYGKDWLVVTVPTAFGAWEGVGPTQKLVDAFAMDNGRYPITGYASDGVDPIIDTESGYSENGFSNYTHPILGDNLNTFKMYQNREPRFYVNVFWSGLTWHGGSNVMKNIQFYRDGNSGPGLNAGHNFPTTGYLAFKFVNPANDTKNGVWNYLSWPLYRYAEVLLNYAEAMNEYDPSDPSILTYLNRVRKRAGVPNIEEVYPDAVGNKDAMRQLIQRERLVELCFENHRFFDTRRWLIAEEENNQSVCGMNIYATDHQPDGAFWTRTVCQKDNGLAAIRKFSKRCYLYPFPQAEVDRVNFTQNYGW